MPIKLNENSGALFSTGADFISSAVGRTEEDKKLFSQAGQTIGNILQTRFYDKQAEDFINNELPEFQKASETYHNMMAQVDMEKNPMGLKSTFDDWRNKVVDPFVYKMSTRYGRNEKIMKIVTDVQNRMNKELGDFISFDKEAGEAQARPGERAKTAQETKTLAAQEEYYRRQAQAKGEGFHETEFEKRLANMPIPPDSTPAQQRYFANQPNEAWKGVDAQTNELLADQFVRQMKQNNAIRPDGKPWGQTNISLPEAGLLSDKELALQEIKKGANYSKEIEYGRIKTAGPWVRYMHQGYYDDVAGIWEGQGSVLLPEEMQRATQLRGNQDAATILAVITGSNKNNFSGIEKIEDYSNAIENMDNPSQLGGSIATTFATTVKSDHGILTDMSGQPIKTYGDLKRALMQNFNARVVDNLVGDDPSSAKTRKQVEKLGEMAIIKFGPDLAAQYNIEIPASELDKAIGLGLINIAKKAKKEFTSLTNRASGLFSSEPEDVEIK